MTGFENLILPGIFPFELNFEFGIFIIQFCQLINILFLKAIYIKTISPNKYELVCLLLDFNFFVLCLLYYYLFVCLFFSHDVVSLFSISGFDCPSGIFRPSLSIFKSGVGTLRHSFIFGKRLS